MDSVEALVAELRAGLAKLPKGPWRHSPWHIEEDFDAVRVAEGWILCTLSSGEYAKHIARCSGENIAALLDHIEAISSENGRLRKALSDAREHLFLRPRGFDMPVINQISAVLSGGQSR